MRTLVRIKVKLVSTVHVKINGTKQMSSYCVAFSQFNCFQIFSLRFKYEKYDKLFGHNSSTTRSSEPLPEKIDKNRQNKFRRLAHISYSFCKTDGTVLKFILLGT